MEFDLDPDDQFFQAFKAGFMRAYPSDRRHDAPSDRSLWLSYINWLYENEATA